MSSANPDSQAAHTRVEPKTSQRDRILALLISAKGGEVPLPAIIACAAQYQTRLLELRRLGWRIPSPRIETVNGKRHTWYRLESEPLLTQASPAREELLFSDLLLAEGQTKYKDPEEL